MLAALGLSAPIFGSRLLPIGTVYDPFIARGLDALNYGCYQMPAFYWWRRRRALRSGQRAAPTKRSTRR